MDVIIKAEFSLFPSRSLDDVDPHLTEARYISRLVPLVTFLFQRAWRAGGLDPVTFGGTLLGVKWFLQFKEMLKLLRKEEVCPVTSFILSSLCQRGNHSVSLSLTIRCFINATVTE